MSNPSTQQYEDEEPEISVDAAVRAPVQPSADRDVVGERFGKYLIVGELAMGGMAEIFLAVQRGLEGFTKVVVIKRVLPNFSQNPEFIQMFIDEARLAARLEHTNIVRTYEFGEVDGQYYTAMEYLPGEDLSKALNNLAISRQQMPLHIAAGIVSGVCAGLHFAHELTDTAGRPLNLVHRDVNPANILITYTGDVKLIDFGVAKTNAGQATTTGTIKGKIAYMSPEQLLARGIDQRSDVFSAGVVLWECLTGRPLFMRDSEAATLYAIMNDPIPPPSRHRPDVPPELDAITMRALSRTPADRYDTAEEMAEALDTFLSSQPKYDARVLSRLVEELFGTTRAEAKRSISQTRSLASNISLVMKLRTEVRSDLAERLESLALGSESRTSSRQLPPIEEPERSSRVLMMSLAAVILLGIAGGVLFMMKGGADPKPQVASAATPAQATLDIESTPPGAAIYVGGEPTGMKTPATLRGLTGKQVELRLELAGFTTTTETVDVSAGGTVKKQIQLSALPEAPGGRLVVGGLPPGATLVVDGEEYQAGMLVNVRPGMHEVRIVVEGKIVAQQMVETTSGDQNWKLDGGKLVAN